MGITRSTSLVQSIGKSAQESWFGGFGSFFSPSTGLKPDPTAKYNPSE